MDSDLLSRDGRRDETIHSGVDVNKHPSMIIRIMTVLKQLWPMIINRLLLVSKLNLNRGQSLSAFPYYHIILKESIIILLTPLPWNVWEVCLHEPSRCMLLNCTIGPGWCHLSDDDFVRSGMRLKAEFLFHTAISIDTREFHTSMAYQWSIRLTWISVKWEFPRYHDDMVHRSWANFKWDVSDVN